MLTIHNYDQDNLRTGDEAARFCVGVPAIEALYKHMHYPFYEENWPSVEPELDDKTLKLKNAEWKADMETRAKCFKKGICMNDCDMVYCAIRTVFKSKTMTLQEFAEKSLQQIQRSAVTLIDELDFLKREGER